MYHPAKHLLQNKYTPLWQLHSLIAVPCHTQKLLGQLKEHDKALKVSTWPDPNPIEHLYDLLEPIHGGSTLQPAELKGSPDNTMVLDTTGHPQKSCVHAWMGQSQVPSMVDRTCFRKSDEFLIRLGYCEFGGKKATP